MGYVRGMPNLAEALERHPLAPGVSQSLARARQRGVSPGSGDTEHAGELGPVETFPRVQEKDLPVSLPHAFKRTAEFRIE